MFLQLRMFPMFPNFSLIIFTDPIVFLGMFQNAGANQVTELLVDVPPVSPKAVGYVGTGGTS